MKTATETSYKIAIVIILILGLFGLLYLAKMETDKSVHLYRIEFEGNRIWTNEVLFREDGGAEFIDLNSKRKYIVYGSYAIIQPKTKNK